MKEPINRMQDKLILDFPSLGGQGGQADKYTYFWFYFHFLYFTPLLSILFNSTFSWPQFDKYFNFHFHFYFNVSYILFTYFYFYFYSILNFNFACTQVYKYFSFHIHFCFYSFLSLTFVCQ